MSDVIKLSTEELEALATLQSNYHQLLVALGQLSLEETDIKTRTEAIKNERTQVESKWKNLQSEESKLIETLSQKYGNGKLNLKDGVFTPA